jgi:hypothetical protein
LKQTNADLRRYYRVANAKYFNNALPEGIPMRFAKIRGTGVTRLLNDRIPILIEINEDLRRCQAITIMTVMHEMLHVEKPSYKGHDWRFDRRMLCLAKQGAFDGCW